MDLLLRDQKMAIADWSAHCIKTLYTLPNGFCDNFKPPKAKLPPNLDRGIITLLSGTVS